MAGVFVSKAAPLLRELGYNLFSLGLLGEWVWSWSGSGHGVDLFCMNMNVYQSLACAS